MNSGATLADFIQRLMQSGIEYSDDQGSFSVFFLNF